MAPHPLAELASRKKDTGRAKVTVVNGGNSYTCALQETGGTIKAIASQGLGALVVDQQVVLAVIGASGIGNGPFLIIHADPLVPDVALPDDETVYTYESVTMFSPDPVELISDGDVVAVTIYGVGLVDTPTYSGGGEIYDDDDAVITDTQIDIIIGADDTALTGPRDIVIGAVVLTGAINVTRPAPGTVTDFAPAAIANATGIVGGGFMSPAVDAVSTPIRVYNNASIDSAIALYGSGFLFHLRFAGEIGASFTDPGISVSSHLHIVRISNTEVRVGIITAGLPAGVADYDMELIDNASGASIPVTVSLDVRAAPAFTVSGVAAINVTAGDPVAHFSVFGTGFVGIILRTLLHTSGGSAIWPGATPVVTVISETELDIAVVTTAPMSGTHWRIDIVPSYIGGAQTTCATIDVA